MSHNFEKKSKRRAFVRPNCNKVWCFFCSVCLKNHYKYGAHNKCYRRWCDLCQKAFDDETQMTIHAKKYHSKNFCSKCNQTFENVKLHKQHFH